MDMDLSHLHTIARYQLMLKRHPSKHNNVCRLQSMTPKWTGPNVPLLLLAEVSAPVIRETTVGCLTLDLLIQGPLLVPQYTVGSGYYCPVTNASTEAAHQISAQSDLIWLSYS